jgi:mono/diheme cytochrome c family protein
VPSSSPAQTWRYPSRTECRICHTQVGGYALSFNTRQLNREQLFGAQTLNQISALSSAGYFSSPVGSVNNFPAFAAAGDTAASREWRVRSYLAVNCIQCHQPGGASTGTWDARATTPTDLANLINGALVNDGGDPANRWCIAGDTGHSMILKRLAGNGVPRMPQLGSNERDLAAEQLIADWITLDLPARKSFSEWQFANFPAGGESSVPTADPDADGQPNSMEFLLGENPLLANAPFLPLATSAGGGFSLSFTHPANRSAIVETTTDFSTWTLWNVPGNTRFFPSSTQVRTLNGPFDSAGRFFRLRLSEP